jgi:hypothetical protein
VSRIQATPAVWILAVGDVLVIGLVTFFGFARHGEIQSAGLRPFTTILPFSIAWFLLAIPIGVYGNTGALDYRQLWRPGAAALAAAPFAAMLRALTLQRPLEPVFVLVLGISVALSLILWRFLLSFLQLRLRPANG